MMITQYFSDFYQFVLRVLFAFIDRVYLWRRNYVKNKDIKIKMIRGNLVVPKSSLINVDSIRQRKTKEEVKSSDDEIVIVENPETEVKHTNEVEVQDKIDLSKEHC